MFIERDAKILLIFNSIIGIIAFSIMYIIFLQGHQSHPNDNFETLQLMLFGIIFVFLLIVTVSTVSLKKEISKQQNYLNNLQGSESKKDEFVKIAYNKSGLYSIIIASILGIIAFLYMFKVFIIDLSHQGTIMLDAQQNTLKLMIIGFLSIFFILLLATFYLLLRRIKSPLYYDFKNCPKCKSNEIYKVEYSWWGGIIGAYLVHQVRCKKCGHAYNGVTGSKISNYSANFLLIGIILSAIFLILRYIY